MGSSVTLHRGARTSIGHRVERAPLVQRVVANLIVTGYADLQGAPDFQFEEEERK
jgi:hypothetical protein